MSTITRPALESSTTARLAYAAGAVGVLANLLLIAFYAIQVGRPERGSWLGPANDLVGSAGSALMVVVALGLARVLPTRPAVRFAQVAGTFAMVLLTIMGPLLVAGVLAFEIQSPIALVCFLVLAYWLVLVNRGLRESALFTAPVTRLGEWSGYAVLVGAVVAAPGLVLPAGSVAQLALFGVGALPAVAGMLAIPIWFIMLGRQLSKVEVAAR
jgi:hypothetical protein